MDAQRMDQLTEIRQSLQDRLTAVRALISADDAEIAQITARKVANEAVKRNLERGITSLTDAAKSLEQAAE